jgi:uncharacterized membrane protein SirB2
MNPLYSALLHTHELLISLYVLVFAIKLVMLLMNRAESLANFRKKTRVIGEMVLPTLFLLTGLILAYWSNVWSEAWFLIKIVLLIVSVFAGIIAFRKSSKALAVITFLIFIYIIVMSYRKDPTLKKAERVAYTPENVITDPRATGYDAVKHGQLLYHQNNCASCHGDNGDLKNHGAKDLTKSTLGDADVENVIHNGRGQIMAAYGKKLNADEIHALAVYVKSLRKS